MTLYEVTAVLKSGRTVVREVEAYSSFNARDLVTARVDVARVVHVQEAVKS